MVKAARVSVAVVASGVLACGLMIVGGVAPAAEPGDRVPADDPSGPGLSTIATDPTDPADSTSTTTSTTTTSTTTTSTTTSTTSTTVAPDPVSPVPISVTPDTVWVGPGGTARISGSCATSNGTPLGPVEIWEVGGTVTIEATGVQGASWSYEWTAPETVTEPLVLQPWCGSPAGYEGGFPAELEVEVIFVGQAAPPGGGRVLAPPANVAAAGSTDDDAIPETG